MKRTEEGACKKKNCFVLLQHMNHEVVGLNNNVMDSFTAENNIIMNSRKESSPSTIDQAQGNESMDVENERENENMEIESTESNMSVENDEASSREPNADIEIGKVIELKTLYSSEAIEKTDLGQNNVNVLPEVLTQVDAVDEYMDNNETELCSSSTNQIYSEKVVFSTNETIKEHNFVVQTPRVQVENEKQNIPNEGQDQQKDLIESSATQNDFSEDLNMNPYRGDTQNSQQQLHSNSKFTIDEFISVKSPSTFSVDSAKGSSLDNDLNWVSCETGDLFWGQIYKFVYWPCMVCPDPEGKTVAMNENIGSEQSQHVVIHVRFFADNGRRSWVKRENMMAYNGYENFQKKQKEVEQKYDKKSLKYKMFFVSANKKKLWDQAIREADMIENIPMNERLAAFFKVVEEIRKTNNLERKRRQSTVNSSCSDLCSMFDSNDNLYMKQSHLKRDRSPTPISPAFSPVTPKQSGKRLKLDHQNTSRTSLLDDFCMNSNENPDTSKFSSEIDTTPSEDIYNDSEFKKFASAMKSFILEKNKDPKINHEFMIHARGMWALKHLTFRERLDDQSSSSGMKRLSQRIRNISIQRSLPSTPVQQQIEPREQQVKKKSTGPKRNLNRPIDEVINDIFELDSKYLFRDLGKEPHLCKECLKSGSELVKCSMNCQTYLHPACGVDCSKETVATPFVHITGDLEDEQSNQPTAPVICKACYSGETNKCFVCKRDNAELGDMTRCNSHQCGKFYHPACLKYWPQSKLTISSGKIESLRCPAHLCHTCVSDDPKGKFLQIEKSKLVKCIKCPGTYHMDSTCIPAGSIFLSATQIICPRHNRQQQDQLLNVNWCFICVKGGKLICCETCPTSVHAECLKIPVADEGYICEECETGRMPLYGEMVWAKYGHFRWWPSIILPPTEIPLNIANKSHNPSEFVIRFFGSNDHAWISRRRVYLYQEGDCSEPPKSSQKGGLDTTYTKGVEEAKRIAEIVKEKKLLQKANNKKEKRITPLPYVKIKSNRAVPPVKLVVDYENTNKCECDKDGLHPCGLNSGCLNRVLYNECNPKICPAGERCENQMFEKKVHPKMEVVYMNEKGFGLVCLEPISAGTFVIEYVGEVIDDAEFRRRIALKEKERDENFYFLTLEKDYIIDAGPKGNLARFMNHSCDPNCETQKWSVNGIDRVGLFAIKDIPKDTELTFNYYWDELLGNEKKMCHCGAKKCAGVIGGKYKEPAVQQTEIVKTRRSTMSKAKNQKLKKDKTKAKEATKKPTKTSSKTSISSNITTISISSNDTASSDVVCVNKLQEQPLASSDTTVGKSSEMLEGDLD